MAPRPFLPTNISSSSSSSLLLLSILSSISILLVLSPSLSLAAKSSSPIPISDEEIADKKQTCYADIESGLWGEKCRSSMIEKENCALRCLSPVCYELIYETDPLEEGERDYIRSQEYRYCMRRTSVGLDVDQVKGTFDTQFEVKAPLMSMPGSVRIVGVRRN